MSSVWKMLGLCHVLGKVLEALYVLSHLSLGTRGCKYPLLHSISREVEAQGSSKKKKNERKERDTHVMSHN